MTYTYETKKKKRTTASSAMVAVHGDNDQATVVGGWDATLKATVMVACVVG